MKKSLLILLLLSQIAIGQINTGTTKSGKYQMNIPELGMKKDSAVVWDGTSKLLKYVPISSVSSNSILTTGNQNKTGKITFLNSVVNPSGLFLNQTNNGSILNITNNGSLSAFTGQTSSSGALIDIGSIGSGAVIKATSSMSGMNYIGTDGSNQTFSVSGKGALIAKTLAVSGGLNTEVLLADGTKNFIDRTLLGNFTTYIPSSKAVKDYVDASRRPYKVYSALISQVGTDAPTAVVLENTIGTIGWGYSGTPGSYLFNAAPGTFPQNKSMCFYGRPSETSTTSRYDILITAGTNNINTSNGGLSVRNASTGAGVDGALVRMSFEIRVYN